MSAAPMRIAIIGGGISGLSTAYYLRKFAAQSGWPLELTLFERKAVLGGNAETVLVNLGVMREGGKPAGDYIRWADLGVNDVNLGTYRRLKAAMEEIGYLQHMKPLQNTESYFTRDGRLALTDDADLPWGVSDPAFSLERACDGKLAPLIQVVHRTALDLIDSGRITPRYTVGDFFDGCVAEPRAMLQPAADRLGIPIDWSDPELPAMLERVRYQIYYPRISAMYFTDDNGPAGMPLQSPFEYYKVQEGGGEQPDRRYFDNGAACWLEALAEYVAKGSEREPAVSIRRGARVGVHVDADGVTVADIDGAGGVGESRHFDLAIMAIHADDALGILEFGDGLADTYRRLRLILGKVRYTRSYAVCHTDSAHLPDNKNVWRTYNIEIRDRQDTFYPYRIDYVVNRHQNDVASPEYDSAGLPQYFVSLVDDLNRIPRRAMLDKCGFGGELHELPREVLDGLPKAVRRQLSEEHRDTGYKAELVGVDPALHRKAWTYFKHNVLDARCIEAQGEIDGYNRETIQTLLSGRPGSPLLFAGGWTRGAGLQEQCMEQAEHLSLMLLSR